MGFFDLKVTCSICNEETGLNRFQIADKGWICPKCFKKAGFNNLTPIKKMSVSEIKAVIEKQSNNLEKFAEFHVTKKVGLLFEIDDNNKQWLIPDGFMGKKNNPKIYSYNDIADYELLEDGESLIKGGLGRAVAGGVLFGGIGAVVGGSTGKRKSKPICNSLRIKITVKDINNPVVYINLLTTSTKKDSILYKSVYNSAQEILSLLQLMCDSQEPVKQNNQQEIVSNADEILKYKSLLDSGIITQEEFEAKKKQLLGV